MNKATHFSIIAAALLATACAATPAPRSGFIGDYSRLEPVRSSDSLLEERPAPGFDLTRYRAIVIEPTEIRAEGLRQTDQQMLAQVFREALLEQLDGSLPVVETAGPDVLRVRSAIIEARRANVAVNAITSLLAAPVSRGGVAAEAEVLDGGTGKRIAALAWSRRGAKIAEIGLSYTRLGDARSGLRAFAVRLADLFAPDPEPGDRRETP